MDLRQFACGATDTGSEHIAAPAEGGCGCDASNGLSPSEARERLLSAVIPLAGCETAALDAALGRVLAADVLAQVDVPPADNSAMDGYAVRAADVPHGGGLLPVVQRIAAGDAPQELCCGGAARIFTGAMMPEGADTVVMQERCGAEGGSVRLPGGIQPGAHVRRAGEDLRRGEPVLSAGRRLQPQDLGLASSAGYATLQVARRVRVALLMTGDELLQPSMAPQPGRIYDSNRATLAGLVQALGGEVALIRSVPDDARATVAALREAARCADLVMTSGGVSVGDEDHVKAAVQALGRLDLWRVAMKPGKPLAFGSVEGIPFLGLPGNPVSLFVTFLLFGAPLLRRLQGRRETFAAPLRLPAAFGRRAGESREEYLRVRIEDGRLRRHPQQGSGVLSSTVWSDGLARIAPNRTFAEGEVLDYFPFHQLQA